MSSVSCCKVAKGCSASQLGNEFSMTSSSRSCGSAACAAAHASAMLASAPGCRSAMPFSPRYISCKPRMQCPIASASGHWVAVPFSTSTRKCGHCCKCCSADAPSSLLPDAFRAVSEVTAAHIVWSSHHEPSRLSVRLRCARLASAAARGCTLPCKERSPVMINWSRMPAI